MEKYIILNNSENIKTAFHYAERMYEKLGTVVLISAIYIFANEMRSKKQNKKIAELEATIKELTTEKGE